MPAMSQTAKETLKNAPRSVCGICHSKRTYTNPMAKCWKCKQKCCFDHITAGMFTEDMNDNDEQRDYCDSCLKTVKRKAT